MRVAVRRRIIRNFVASILSSDLSRSDIYEMMDELQTGRFSYELAEVLRDVMMILREEPARYEVSPVLEPPEPVKIAYGFIQKRKMSKRALFDTMIALGAKPPKNLQGGTTRQLLEWFFAGATPTQADKFLGVLGGDKQDQYLKGIVGRE
jgi:hypothetical protein